MPTHKWLPSQIILGWCCSMRPKLNVLYRNAAEEFAQRVVSALHGSVNTIVLFGSVARRRATRESDVDLLIVTPYKNRIRKMVADIEEDVDSRNDYDTFLISLYFTPEEVQLLARSGSPLIANILQEGVVLYDDGFFTRLREEVFATR